MPDNINGAESENKIEGIKYGVDDFSEPILFRLCSWYPRLSRLKTFEPRFKNIILEEFAKLAVSGDLDRLFANIRVDVKKWQMEGVFSDHPLRHRLR